jgi:hypothetical protein
VRETAAVIAGIVLIGAVIWEVFKDLFHPAHSGALSDWLGRRLFTLLRRHPPALPLAGPLTVVLVIGAWVVLLGGGFALVFYGGFPEHFRNSSGETPPMSPRFLSAVYFSFATLVTLGYGDLVPESPGMRLIAVSEGLLGFGLLTASVSSIVLLCPALARMRLLASTVAHLAAAERATGVAVAGCASEAVLSRLARDVSHARIDLVHFPVIYYFATVDRNRSVAQWIPEMARLAREGAAPSATPDVRLAAGVLERALDDLAALLAERFVRVGSRDRAAIFAAFARDHALDPA